MTKLRAIVSLLVISAVSLALAACVTSPSSRTPGESDAAVTLKGYTTSGKQTITIEAVDQNTGALVPLGTTKSEMTGMPFITSGGTPYTAYPWTYPAGILDKKYWSPQNIVPDLATAQGHLEIVASANGNLFNTFSQAAMNSVLSSGKDPAAAGAEFADGTSTVLFDQDGVGSGPEGSWVNDSGMISNPPTAGYSKVAWSVGHYTVEGGKKIYGLICTPTTGGPYPVIIFNHGGTGLGNGGNVNGTVTASGWTVQPSIPPAMPGGPPTLLPDTLGQCIDWAKRGWIYAASSYRGENVNITSSDPDFPGGTWTSEGLVEFCMGEITDVMALTDLLAHHAASISVGSASHMVPLNVNGKMFMYGYSHGGCITHRAVEQGAPVSAYSVMEGFTDLRLSYLLARNAGKTAVEAAALQGAFQPPIPPGLPIYQPDTNGVMGYNWRSAHYFASRGDLGIQKFTTMPILIMHGDVDTGNPVPLAHPVELAADIGATNIFVGPMGASPPSSVPCITGPVGAPLTASSMTTTCPVSFILKDMGDPCYTPPYTFCKPIKLPLTPAPGEPTQQHYLVVWNKVDHTNGGLAIRYTLDSFVETNFGPPAGCDGLQWDCASD